MFVEDGVEQSGCRFLDHVHVLLPNLNCHFFCKSLRLEFNRFLSIIGFSGESAALLLSDESFRS